MTIGAILTVALVVVSLPVLFQRGGIAANPSSLDRNYPVGLAVAVAVVWLGCGSWLVYSWWLSRRRSRSAVAAA